MLVHVCTNIWKTILQTIPKLVTPEVILCPWQAHKMASTIRENVLESHVTEIWGSEVPTLSQNLCRYNRSVGTYDDKSAIMDSQAD